MNMFIEFYQRTLRFFGTRFLQRSESSFDINSYLAESRREHEERLKELRALAKIHGGRGLPASELEKDFLGGETIPVARSSHTADTAEEFSPIISEENDPPATVENAFRKVVVPLPDKKSRYPAKKGAKKKKKKK
jgi:hypothetical protein